MKRLMIDGDGCPVVDSAVYVAREFGWKSIIICDTSHHFERQGAETVTVSKGPDSVDFALVNMLEPDDVVVTQDYGLAAMCLAKQAVPISQDGLIYSRDNIDGLLMARHTAKKIRMSGGRLKGPKKRSTERNTAFENTLRGLLAELEAKK
jgi:Uncharacterized protein conserved in bacteria